MPTDASLPDPAPRESQINIRIDTELQSAATAKAGRYGLGVVVRALLRAFVAGRVELQPDDLLRELASAPRGRPAGRKPRKK